MFERQNAHESTSEATDLEQWSTYVNALNEGLETANNEDVEQLLKNVLPLVDQLYPYVGEKVYVAGSGVFPVLENSVFKGETWNDEATAIGEHEGFIIMAVNSAGQQKRRVMHQVLIGESSQNIGVTLEQNNRLYAYFDAQTSEVVPTEAIDEIYNVVNKDDANHEVLVQLEQRHKLAKEFAELLSSDVFRRLAQDEQRTQTDNFLVNANEQLKIRGLNILVSPRHIYRTLYFDGELEYVPYKIDGAVIGGECLGVDSVDASRLGSGAVWGEVDLWNKNDELCIVIDPNESTRESLDLCGQEVLHIPLGGKQYFDIEIDDQGLL